MVTLWFKGSMLSGYCLRKLNLLLLNGFYHKTIQKTLNAKDDSSQNEYYNI